MAKGGRASEGLERGQGPQQPAGRVQPARPVAYYEVLDTVEAGIVLRGSEVQSLREACEVQLADTTPASIDGEAWLRVGLHIAPYRATPPPARGTTNPSAPAEAAAAPQGGLSPRCPSSWPSSASRWCRCPSTSRRGKAKLWLALGKGRNVEDKRQVIAKRDAERDVARAVARAGRGD